MKSRLTSTRIPRRLTAAALILIPACTTPTDSSLRSNESLLLPPEAASANAAGTVTTAWSNEPGGVSVAVDAADNVLTARWDYNPAGDIYVAKRAANGTLLWEVRYDNLDNTRHEVATWVGTDLGGNVLVSGTIRSGFSNPVNANSVLMKFSPAGALLWRRVYDTPFDGSSTRKLLVDATGNVYVLGIGITQTGQRTTIRKFAPDGTFLWAWFDPAGIGAPLNVKFSPDGALLVSARAISGSINGYAKVSTSGTTIWTTPGIASLTAGDIAGDASGNAYLINGNYATGSGSLLRKVGPSAVTLWERPHPIAGFRVEVGSDQAPVISGFPSSGTVGAAFAKFDAAGTLAWTNLDADGPSVALLAHGQMQLDALNNAYLAASTMSQMGVTKVTSAGASDWTALVPYGYAVGLAFGTQGRVFVVGGTTARLDQQGAPPPPVNTPPTVSIVPLSAVNIRVGQAFRVQATVTDPDVGDGPWSYTWRWGNGTSSGAWASPGTYSASRTFTVKGKYWVKVRVTDARGAAVLSNEVAVTVR